MNIYQVTLDSGEIEEIEADFFEREEDDWVFFSRGQRGRSLWISSVVGIVKIPMAPLFTAPGPS